VDDFGLDALDAQESRDSHALIWERHRAGCEQKAEQHLERREN
jgi:hypothetical protein